MRGNSCSSFPSHIISLELTNLLKKCCITWKHFLWGPRSTKRGLLLSFVSKLRVTKKEQKLALKIEQK
eukprot:UN06226